MPASWSSGLELDVMFAPHTCEQNQAICWTAQAAGPKTSDAYWPAGVEYVARAIPMGRWGTEEEIAAWFVPL
jgi:hypothetical protein